MPGSTTHSLALYYMMTTPLKDSPLLESFVNGDDAFRNSRFKLIPYISKVCEIKLIPTLFKHLFCAIKKGLLHNSLVVYKYKC